MKQTTIVFPICDDQVLLGMKKRGFAEGKRNGFGGKLEGDETFVQNALRELKEEAKIVLSEDQFELRAIVEFCIKDDVSGTIELFNFCHVFTVVYDGLGQETEEMRPQQFPITQLPLDQMFEGDRIWVQKILTEPLLQTLKLRILYTPDFQLLGYEELD